MSAQIDYIWVLVGTVVLIATALTLALFVIYHNRKEIAGKERELDILKEKQEVESQLQRANRMVIIGALTGGMAYYLNSTLFAIRSLMEMMGKDQGTKKSMNELSRLTAEEITRGLKVTDQLQQLAHPQKLSLRQLSVTELLDSTLSDLKHRFHESIKIRANFNSNKNIVLGDRILLRQVLVNLLTNAADAMPNGGKIVVSVSSISGSDEGGVEVVDENEKNLVIRVSDTGCGLDGETKRRIFEPFFTTKMRPERLGLGLSFAYGIAKIHNGQIIVESEKDQGTTVSLYLPIPSQEQLDQYKKQDLGEDDITLDNLTFEQRLDLLQQDTGQA